MQRQVVYNDILQPHNVHTVEHNVHIVAHRMKAHKENASKNMESEYASKNMGSTTEHNFNTLKNHVIGLWQTERLADCRFLVGADSSNQRIIKGHKLILALVSPVFERMFYSEHFKNEDPIDVPDVQPDAFQAMLECIYWDKFKMESVDKAYELCYVARKYMLSAIVQQCTIYLKNNLTAKNAARTYEFAVFLELQSLIESSMKLIVEQTQSVLTNPSFKDIKISTFMDILDQNILNIDSELHLFNAIIRFANYRGELKFGTVENKNTTFIYSPPFLDLDDVNNKTSESDALKNKEEVELTNAALVSNEESIPSAADKSTDSVNSSYGVPRITIDELREAVKKIRFLTMTPQEFVDGPARSKLLQTHEIYAIIMNNISSLSIKDPPMPKGFCISKSKRVQIK